MTSVFEHLSGPSKALERNLRISESLKVWYVQDKHG